MRVAFQDRRFLSAALGFRVRRVAWVLIQSMVFYSAKRIIRTRAAGLWCAGLLRERLRDAALRAHASRGETQALDSRLQAGRGSSFRSTSDEKRRQEAGLSLSAPCPGLALQALEVAASVIVREAPILNPETLHALHCLALPCTARSRSWPSRASRLGSPERRSPQHGMAWELWTSARRGVHPTELLAASRAVRLQTPITLFCSLQAFAVLSRLPNDDIGRVSIDFLRCRPKATCSPRVLTWSGSLQH